MRSHPAPTAGTSRRVACDLHHLNFVELVHTNQPASITAIGASRPLEEEADSSNYALIPTAEVPLTNLVRDEIIDEDRYRKACPG